MNRVSTRSALPTLTPRSWLTSWHGLTAAPRFPARRFQRRIRAFHKTAWNRGRSGVVQISRARDWRGGRWRLSGGPHRLGLGTSRGSSVRLDYAPKRFVSPGPRVEANLPWFSRSCSTFKFIGPGASNFPPCGQSSAGREFGFRGQASLRLGNRGSADLWLGLDPSWTQTARSGRRKRDQVPAIAHHNPLYL